MGASIWDPDGSVPTGVQGLINRLANVAPASDGAGMIGRGAQVVGSILELKALLKTSPSAFAIVTGYYSTGANLGRLYRYDPSDITSIDNTGTIIVAADGGRWKMITGGVVSLEDFGAYGDGVTSDATPANQACKWCFETGDTLRLKGKNYAGARLEVHGSFNIEGGGSTVEYLGVGYTLIAGSGTGTAAVPTPWSTDPGIYNATAYLPVLYSLTATTTVGAQSLSVASSTGIVAGDLVFVCDSATSPSSPTNYIPRDFEFARVLSVSPTLITFIGRLQNAYGTTGVIVRCPGIAIGCEVDNLKLKSPTDAYQQVVRSAYSVKLSNIELAGQSAAGAATFSDMLEYDGIKISGTYGPMSTARGCVNVSLKDIEWQPRTGAVGEACAVFIEESFYSISLKNVRSYGGYLSVRQANQAGSVSKRHIAVNDSFFDTTNASAGATAPIQIGDIAGVSMTCTNVTLVGTCVVPNAGSYPGIAGAPFTWIASSSATDVFKFIGCTLNSSNGGAAFTPGSGMLGSVQFDEMCNYTTCTPPLTQYTPRGAWVDMTSGLLNGFTVTASSVAKYRIQNKTLYMKGRLDLNGAAAGTNFFLFPVNARPLTEAKWSVANNANTVVSMTRVSTAGDAFYVNSGGAITYIQLDQMFFPIDI